MSRTRPTSWQQTQLAYQCDRCNAEPGHWCTTLAGHWAIYLHAERHWAAQAAAIAYHPR